MKKTILVIGTLLSASVLAQEASDQKQSSPSTKDIPLEVFQGPQIKTMPLPRYPMAELNAGVEGWVDINFMVSPEGKPYELTVRSSSGINKGLEKSVLRAAEKWTFEPATLDGNPIDSSSMQKITFKISDLSNGAGRDFVRGHKDLLAAITANDQSAANAAFKKMQVKNLYEDAYYGLSQFLYAEKWGNIEQQLSGVRRAVAGEQVATYLPKKVFSNVLLQQFRLELETQDFGSLLQTWETMEKGAVDNSTLDKLRPTVAKVKLLKADSRAYKVPGRLRDGYWNYYLFKNTFRIDVLKGRVSQVKLRCDKKYVFFQFDPNRDYLVSDKFGKCIIEVLGDADTQFELMQM